jgi:hypothetical protein
MQLEAGVVSPAVKRSEREINQSSVSGVEITNGGVISPLYHLYSWGIAQLINMYFRRNALSPVQGRAINQKGINGKDVERGQ